MPGSPRQTLRSTLPRFDHDDEFLYDTHTNLTYPIAEGILPLVIEKFMAARAAVKQAERDRQDWQALLVELLGVGGEEVLHVDAEGAHMLKAVSQRRRRFNAERWRADMPELTATEQRLLLIAANSFNPKFLGSSMKKVVAPFVDEGETQPFIEVVEPE